VGGRVARRTRSTWIQRVEDAVHPPAPGAEPSDGAARESIAAARDRVARAKGGTRTKTATDVAESDAPLYAALVDWRLRQSRAASAPAYVIFPNTTLAAIATARPRTPRALLDVPGVGPVKADRYGEAVLALVAEHAR
jgi:superfamily II DNA helicase RecQ